MTSIQWVANLELGFKRYHMLGLKSPVGGSSTRRTLMLNVIAEEAEGMVLMET
jgi:hypothetical protein